MIRFRRLLHLEEPSVDLLLLLLNVAFVLVRARDNSRDGQLEQCEDYKAEAFVKECHLVLECRTTRVVAVTHRRDHREDPVSGEDVQLVATHPLKVPVGELPGQVIWLVVKKGLPTYVDPQARQVVQQDEDLGDG